MKYQKNDLRIKGLLYRIMEDNRSQKLNLFTGLDLKTHAGHCSHLCSAIPAELLNQMELVNIRVHNMPVEDEKTDVKYLKKPHRCEPLQMMI